KAKVSNRTREIWPSGIIGGLRESHGGTVNPSCNRKSRSGNHLQRDAPRVYPSGHRHLAWVNRQREEPDVQWKAAAFARWHDPDDARVSSPVLGGLRLASTL